MKAIRMTTVAALTATLGLAAACWVASARLMTGMDMGVATRLGSTGFFVAVWVVMMAAMMLPGAAPAVARATWPTVCAPVHCSPSPTSPSGPWLPCDRVAAGQSPLSIVVELTDIAAFDIGGGPGRYGTGNSCLRRKTSGHSA
jgi:hypothetical protein